MSNPTEHIKKTLIRLTASLTLVVCASCGNATNSKPEEVIPGYKVKDVETGKASWYSVRTNRGYSTASGERLDERAPTAAHKTLPMGTKVRVTNLVNGNSEVVRINDRGPFIKGRIIDVTIGTAEKLGFVRSGVVPVKVEVLKKIDDE
ncbi:MAG: septal ring lytic transglycosylase RlpA family protein [Luteolibacter sp.]|jgi:rare lipoprotein A